MPEFMQQIEGNHFGFINLLFHWMFILCALLFPFILYYLAFIFNHLQKGENLQIGVDKFVGKVLINLLHHSRDQHNLHNYLAIHLPLLLISTCNSWSAPTQYKHQLFIIHVRVKGLFKIKLQNKNEVLQLQKWQGKCILSFITTRFQVSGKINESYSTMKNK